MRSRSQVAILLLLFAPPAVARAEERPPEVDLFGEPAKEEPARRAPAPDASTGAGPRPPRADSPAGEAERGGARALEGEPGAERRLVADLARTDNPMQIGGVLYLRSNVTSREHTPPSDWTLTAPCLTDLYLDARPTDRVRGFVLGRMQFDPTQGANVAGSPSGATTSNPRVLLDQLWIRFDVAQTAFVTVGRQHVKWGVGKFWNPTDYLHAVRRDPLSTFDDRTGTFMARVHLPWEKQGWNLYGMAIFEPVGGQATSLAASTASGGTGAATGSATVGTGSQLGGVGVGARAEIVLGGWELGIDGVAQRGIRPRFGVDLSGGLWEIDLHGELAIRTTSDVALYRLGPAGPTTYEPDGVRPMAVLGAEWEHKYSDEDTYTIGVEYFYNSNGYDDSSLYPVLVAQNAFTPFYLGRHYAAAYLRLPQPGSWNLHTFTLSLLANLSDRSAVARLDWSMTLLTYLTLEAYLQGHFGASGGELRFGLDVPATGSTPAISLGTPIADVGLNLRLKL